MRKRITVLLVVGVVALLLGWGDGVSAAQVGGVAAVPTATRPPVPPLPTFTPPSAAPVTPEGAYIELRFAPGEELVSWSGLWTVVQWQDGLGEWHDVTGWQGTPDGVVDDGVCWKRWWLPADLFGRGPFRWLVYATRGGDVVAASEPFHLPQRPGEVMAVEIGR